MAAKKKTTAKTTKAKAKTKTVKGGAPRIAKTPAKRRAKKAK